MSLPNQPSSNDSVLDSQEIYRIFQDIESPGSIYEIDVSTRSIFVGPLSDVSEIRVAYFDSQAGGDLQQIADISVGGPFVGRLDALIPTEYSNINQPARILVYPVDIVDPDYVRPTGPAAVPARRYNKVAKIDLIAGTKALPELPSVRPDQTLRLARVPFNNEAGMEDDGSTDIVIPIYGRRMVTVNILTQVMTAHLTSFYLAALQPGQSSFAKFLGQIQKAAISVTDTDSVVFRASDQINRDEITAVGSSSTPTTFDWLENSGPPLPKCKGMADLLIINIKPDYIGPPAPGYSLVDVFVRLSDRED